jgi:hypothetical protein
MMWISCEGKPSLYWLKKQQKMLPFAPPNKVCERVGIINNLQLLQLKMVN